MNLILCENCLEKLMIYFPLYDDFISPSNHSFFKFSNDDMFFVEKIQSFLHAINKLSKNFPHFSEIHAPRTDN